MATGKLGWMVAAVWMNTVASGSSMFGRAREPRRWRSLRHPWLSYLGQIGSTPHNEGITFYWVIGLEGSIVSHTHSNTLTLCPLWTTELSQTLEHPPIFTSVPSSCFGREIPIPWQLLRHFISLIGNPLSIRTALFWLKSKLSLLNILPKSLRFFKTIIKEDDKA